MKAVGKHQTDLTCELHVTADVSCGVESCIMYGPPLERKINDKSNQAILNISLAFARTLSVRSLEFFRLLCYFSTSITFFNGRVGLESEGKAVNKCPSIYGDSFNT